VSAYNRDGTEERINKKEKTNASEHTTEDGTEERINKKEKPNKDER
jgi:hypothetical protein